MLGGCCFCLIGRIGKMTVRFPLRCALCATGITAAEFLCGLLCNRVLLLDVWDYSGMPMNVMGQICLPFSLLWLLLSAGAIPTYQFLERYLLTGQKLLRKPDVP